MKKCSKCSIVKSFNDFYADKRNKTGLMSGCKKCMLAQTAERRALIGPQFKERFESPCDNCQSTLMLTQGQLNMWSNHYCNKSCYDEFTELMKVFNIKNPNINAKLPKIKGKSRCDKCEILMDNPGVCVKCSTVYIPWTIRQNLSTVS